MKAAHQGVPIAELPSGVWRNADAPAPEIRPARAAARNRRRAARDRQRRRGRLGRARRADPARALARRIGRPRAARLNSQRRQLRAVRAAASRQEPARQIVRGDPARGRRDRRRAALTRSTERIRRLAPARRMRAVAPCRSIALP